MFAWCFSKWRVQQRRGNWAAGRAGRVNGGQTVLGGTDKHRHTYITRVSCSIAT